MSKPNVHLAPLTVKNINSLIELGNNPKVAQMLRNGFPHPYTEEDALAFIESAKENMPVCRLGIFLDDVHVGNIGVHVQDDIYSRTAELGYFVGEKYWGLGIASEAIRQIIQLAFNELNLIRLEAGVFEHNPASMRVLEKNGFIKEGIARFVASKNGEVFDEHKYGIINPEYKSS